MATAVAGNAVVAGERAVTYGVEHAEAVCQGPRFALVNPHERRVDDELLFHGKVERHVERTDEAVATVGVAGEVGLRHTRHQVADAALAGIDGCNAQEEKVAAGHKRVGRSVGGLHLVHHYGLVRQRIVGEGAYETHIHAVEMDTGFAGYLFGQVHFVDVLLTIDETEGIHFLEVLLCPKEACR